MRSTLNTANLNTAKSVLEHDLKQKRLRLMEVLSRLENGSSSSAERRLALAEAEFRLAVLQDTELEEAVARVRKAADYDPFHPKFFYHLGRLLHRSGNFRGAIDEYRHALRLAPASHRTYVHLALSLLELGEKEKELGRSLLDAIAGGYEKRLKELLTNLDALMEAHRSLSEAKKGANKTQAASDEDGKPSGEGDAKKSKSSPVRRAQQSVEADKGEAGECRWNGVWKLSLADHLSSSPKLMPKKIDNYLDSGARFLKEDDGIADYAIVCLLQLFVDESPKAIDGMLEKRDLKSQTENPAVILVNAALALAEEKNPEQFVENASEAMRAEILPIEIVCCLHYLNYGPDGSMSAAEALKLLDKYPESIRNKECFKELRLAMLDGFARKAWVDERYDRAKILWQESIPLDPNRIEVAHNLALLASKTRSYDDYAPTWERAAELRYLNAAAAGDLQAMLEDRKTLHLSFAQQSRQRYCPTEKSREDPKAEELTAWISDKDALEVWLREWDLYYLNSRLRFHSPVHLLGVARDASAQTIDYARKSLLSHIDSSLLNRPWAGIKTFCELGKRKVEEAFRSASDMVERARDAYYEQEKPAADQLAQEAIDRGFLMHHMLEALIKKAEAKNVPAGCAIARHLFALPWKILQSICADRGMDVKDLDLAEVFEDRVLGLAAADKSEPKTDREISARIACFDECIAVLPHRMELHLMRCQFLLAAKKNYEAYNSALNALELVSKLEDKKEAEIIKNNLLIIIDNAAHSSLPESVRERKKDLDLKTAQELVKEGCKAVERFPKAGGFRASIAGLMIQLGDPERIKSAIKLSEKGLELALNQEQKKQFEDLLKEAKTKLKAAGAVAEIKNLFESAQNRINNAVEKFNLNPSQESVDKCLADLEASIQEIEKAKRMAAEANIGEAKEQADKLIKRFRDMIDQFKDINRKLKGH